MSKLSMASSLLALAIPVSSAFAQATAVSPTLRDLAQNSETIELVVTTRKAAAQKVQDYCDGVYTPAKKVPYFTNTIS